MLRVDVEVGAHSHAITMSEVGLVVAAVTARPLDVVVAQTIAVAMVFGVVRRLAPVKVVFNVVLVATVTGIAVVVMDAIGIGGPAKARTALAGLAGGLTSGVLTTLGTGLVLTVVASAAGQRDDRRELAYAVVSSVAGALASAAIGLQIVFLGRQSVWLVSLAAVPVALMYFTFRTYAGQRRSAERSEFLHHAAIALHDSTNLDEGLLAMLEHTRAAVRAEFARAVLLTADGAVTLVAHHDPNLRLPMSAASDEIATAARLLIAGLSHAALLDDDDPAARALLRALGMRDGIAVPLQRDDEQAGLLVAANRLGDFDEFRGDDVRLVELVANQIGVALEKGWLEQSLRQLVELEGRLKHQAHHDGLTGVANRRLFNDHLGRIFERRDECGAALILVDLDDFKSINDTHGHVAGDELLSVVAQRLHTGVRSGDLVARIGGDEFAIVLDGVDGPPTAVQRAAAIVDALRQPVHVQERMITAPSSVGVALVDATVRSPGDLLRNADAALYRAKALGKNCYVLFQPEMHTETDRRRRRLRQIGEAIGSRQFQLRYEPVFDLVSGELVGAEAAPFWRHPEHGPLSSRRFVTDALDAGMGVELGRQVIEEAVATFAGMLPAVHADRRFRLSVRITAPEIGDPGWIDLVDHLLQVHRLPPNRLVLQADEVTFRADPELTAAAIGAMRHLGVHLALDGFGAGTSALSHVHELPFDELIVDGMLIRSVGHDERTDALVGAIVHFANALGITAVADGIDDAGQVAALCLHGCRFGRGPLLSGPLSAVELGTLVRAERSRPAWVR